MTETTTISGKSMSQSELNQAMADNEAGTGAKNDDSTCQTSCFELSTTWPQDVTFPINSNIVGWRTLRGSTVYYYLKGPKRGYPCLSMGRDFRDPLPIFDNVPKRITLLLDEEWCVELHRLLDWVSELCIGRDTLNCEEIGLVLCSYPMEGLEKEAGTCANLILFDRDELYNKSQVPHSNFDCETEGFESHDCILSVYNLHDQGAQKVEGNRYTLWFELGRAFGVELPAGVSATYSFTKYGTRWKFAAPWVTYKIMLAGILTRYLHFLNVEVDARQVTFKQVIQFKYPDSASDSASNSASDYASDSGEEDEREKSEG